MAIVSPGGRLSCGHPARTLPERRGGRRERKAGYAVGDAPVSASDSRFHHLNLGQKVLRGGGNCDGE
jgi:hypothetical protein